MACDCFERAKVKVREATGDPLAKIRSRSCIVKRKKMVVTLKEIAALN